MKFSAPAARVEADQVVGEQPVVDRSPDPVGEHVPVVGLRPGDVDEVREQRVRRARRGRAAARGRGGSRGRRPPPRARASSSSSTACAKVSLTWRVAAVPRVLERDVDRRLVRELPEVVLEEPEHRVRDDVVVPVVGRLVVRDEAQPERRAVARLLLDRGAAGVDRDRPVLVASSRSRSRSRRGGETRLRSAVTSPPPPRRATRSPSASRPYVTGPRFETTISLRRRAIADHPTPPGAASRPRRRP